MREKKKKKHNQGATFHMCAIGHPHNELQQTVSFSSKDSCRRGSARAEMRPSPDNNENAIDRRAPGCGAAEIRGL